MSFAIYYKPSGTIDVTSTGIYGVKDELTSVSVGSLTYPGSTSPDVSLWDDMMGDRWVVFLDDLVEGDYTVQLAVGGSTTQPDEFGFAVGSSRSLVSVTHPANNATVKARNVVAWGDSTHSISEATLTVNGVAHTGTVLRGPSANRPYVIQFPSLTLTAATSGTLYVKNSNDDEVTVTLTVDP